MSFPKLDDRIVVIIESISKLSPEDLANSPFLGQLIDILAQDLAMKAASRGMMVSTVVGYRVCTPNLLPHLVPFSRGHGRQTALMIGKASEMLDKIANGYEAVSLEELGGFCVANNIVIRPNTIRFVLGMTGSKQYDTEEQIVEAVIRQLRDISGRF